jgi:hypothetical protein
MRKHLTNLQGLLGKSYVKNNRWINVGFETRSGGPDLESDPEADPKPPTEK